MSSWNVEGKRGWVRMGFCSQNIIKMSIHNNNKKHSWLLFFLPALWCYIEIFHFAAQEKHWLDKKKKTLSANGWRSSILDIFGWMMRSFFFICFLSHVIIVLPDALKFLIKFSHFTQDKQTLTNRNFHRNLLN